MSVTALIILVILLIAVSGLVSGYETAFATSNRVRIHNNAENGDKRAIRAQKVIDDFPRALSAILFINDLTNIAASSAMTVIAITLFPESAGTAETVAGAILTVALLIFGEILPKVIAAESSESIALSGAGPVLAIKLVCMPVVAAVSAIVGKLSPLWKKDEEEPQVTSDELVTLLETIEDEGVFTEKEGDLIRSALEFPDVTAHDILTPRVDVEAFDVSDGAEALASEASLLKYSRIPVYDDGFDDIIGILPTKKFMRAVIDIRRGGGDVNALDLRPMLLPPMYVHMTRPISSILDEMTRTHIQMAIVVDEYGGNMGIVTIEDILEEIVGEIYDEHDEVERAVISVNEEEHSYVVDAGMNVYDMFELVGFNPEAHDFESEYTTVGGWATEMLDRFPAEGDVFEYENLTVTVLEAQPMRAETVRIDVTPEEDDEEE